MMDLSGESEVEIEAGETDWKECYYTLLNKYNRKCTVLREANKKVIKLEESPQMQERPAFDMKMYNMLMKAWGFAKKYSGTKVRVWKHGTKSLNKLNEGTDNYEFLTLKKYMESI